MRRHKGLLAAQRLLACSRGQSIHLVDSRHQPLEGSSERRNSEVYLLFFSYQRGSNHKSTDTICHYVEVYA